MFIQVPNLSAVSSGPAGTCYSRPLHLGERLFLTFLTAGIILGFLILAPVWPCHACKPCEQLIGYTHLPGISPEDARKMIAWGESFPCSRCGGFRRLSLWNAVQMVCS
jgi:hypothetical protein